MNKNVSNNDLLVILEDEMKIYLSLQKTVYEFIEAYKIEPSDVLKEILLKVIHNAKDQNFVLLDMVSKFYKGEEQIQYSNMLGKQLNELQNIEKELKMPFKKR